MWYADAGLNKKKKDEARRVGAVKIYGLPRREQKQDE